MATIRPRPTINRAVRSPQAAPKFHYQPRTPEQVRERAQRSIGGRDSYFNSDIQFFTAREGDNNVRILPPPPDADWGHYGVGIVVHYGIGPDQGAYLCLDRMKSEPCPICEERAHVLMPPPARNSKLKPPSPANRSTRTRSR